jgi:hypothetical protein
MGKVPTVKPLAVPRFINRSEFFIGTHSDADRTRRIGTPLDFTLHKGNREVKKERKKERMNERKKE